MQNLIIKFYTKPYSIFLQRNSTYFLNKPRILGGSAHTIQKNTEALLVASKETGLEVNADRTKYMVMSRDHNAGRSHNIKIDNSSFERVEEFKYLGTTLMHQTSIQEKLREE